MDLTQEMVNPQQHWAIPVVKPTQDEEGMSDEALLLRYHRQFGHISFSRLQQMADIGVIPKRLKDCRVPMCSACLYAKATKNKWRGKQKYTYKPKDIVSPGELISVDQLESPTPGLVAQMVGHLTTKRYKYATVFVDQASKLGYIYLQQTNSALEILEAKAAFQQHSLDRGVIIKAYHADNGIFKANDWQQACRNERQRLTFSGVNAHFTNGLAEKRIRDLQDLTRTELIYSATK